MKQPRNPHDGDQTKWLPAVPKETAENFTGAVRIAPLFEAQDPSRVSGTRVTFEPGVRTAWHTHPLDQTLIVTYGLGWTQVWGGPVEEIRPGEVVRCPPGVKHWHGATTITAMTHIAIQEALNGESSIGWKRSATSSTGGDSRAALSIFRRTTGNPGRMTDRQSSARASNAQVPVPTKERLMTQGIKDKVAVITGASSGLGEETARYLSAQRAGVVLGARRSDRITSLARELSGRGGKAAGRDDRLTDRAQMKRLVDSAVAAYGRIDVMLNSAGLMQQSPLERLKVGEWAT